MKNSRVPFKYQDILKRFNFRYCDSESIVHWYEHVRIVYGEKAGDVQTKRQFTSIKASSLEELFMKIDISGTDTEMPLKKFYLYDNYFNATELEKIKEFCNERHIRIIKETVRGDYCTI